MAKPEKPFKIEFSAQAQKSIDNILLTDPTAAQNLMDALGQIALDPTAGIPVQTELTPEAILELDGFKGHVVVSAGLFIGDDEVRPMEIELDFDNGQTLTVIEPAYDWKELGQDNLVIVPDKGIKLSDTLRGFAFKEYFHNDKCFQIFLSNEAKNLQFRISGSGWTVETTHQA